MGYLVKEVQPTPNPNAMKFILDRPISEGRLSFLDPAAGHSHAIAARLFAVNGVTSLLFLGDFVTVCKSPAVRWAGITAKVKRVLAGD
ncbi:MAG: Scaffold protein Nfu/NifU [Phycisphaerales bacterium]|nr:Scaffold protein Nfu/NifU [Phycisphaerales bacterium]MDB5300700.1 Scaffold protein Nfu/NifU [Phycisphaerales bacterium]MDB5303432.1 Scaffold protein Nfu/NifU [Phycisphaerales bacterium]